MGRRGNDDEGGGVRVPRRVFRGWGKLYRYREFLVCGPPSSFNPTLTLRSQDGETEEWIGEWMESRQNRDQIVLATKVRWTTTSSQPLAHLQLAVLWRVGCRGPVGETASRIDRKLHKVDET